MKRRILGGLAMAAASGGVAVAAPTGTVGNTAAVVAQARSAVASGSPAATARRTLATGSVNSAVTALASMRGAPVTTTLAPPLAGSSWRAAANYLLAEVRAARTALGPRYVE